MRTRSDRVTQTVDIATQAGSVGLSTVFWLNGADDDYTTAAQVLSERGVRLVRLREVDDLVHLLEPAEHAMCVIDLAIGSGVGQALCAIRTSYPKTLVVGIVDPRRREGALEAFQKGVFDVLSAPVSIVDFASVVRNAEEFLALADPAVDESPSTPEAAGLVLASGTMRRLMELVQRVGMARCHVMIAGEFGTGRETVARLLHASSARSEGPFIKLDCNGASFAELNDALFGRGAPEDCWPGRSQAACSSNTSRRCRPSSRGAWLGFCGRRPTPTPHRRYECSSPSSPMSPIGLVVTLFAPSCTSNTLSSALTFLRFDTGVTTYLCWRVRC